MMWVEKGKTSATPDDIEVTLKYNEWLSRMIDKHGISFIQGEHQEDFLELFLRQNITLLKEIETGIDSTTGKELTTQEKLLKMTTLANSMLTAGVAIKGVIDVGKTSTSKSTIRKKKASRAKNVIKNNLGKEIDITPSKVHTKVNKNPGPFGEPNSSIDILDSKGELTTRRFYDDTGKTVRDVDMTNHGNPRQHPEYPHEHKWKYDSNGKPTRE